MPKKDNNSKSDESSESEIDKQVNNNKCKRPKKSYDKADLKKTMRLLKNFVEENKNFIDCCEKPQKRSCEKPSCEEKPRSCEEKPKPKRHKTKSKLKIKPCCCCDDDDDCCCECAECVEASHKLCNAPIADKAFNVIFTELPKCLMFTLPPPRTGSIADITALTTNNGTISPSQVIDFRTNAPIPVRPIASTQPNSPDPNILTPPPVPEPFPIGSITPADIIAGSNPLDAINDVLESAIANAMINGATEDFVDDMIDAASTALGIRVVELDPLNYFIKLPCETCGDIEIEWTLKWIIGSLISKINQTIFGGGMCCDQRFGRWQTPSQMQNSTTKVGIINQHIILNINTQGKSVRNFAELNPNQNTVNMKCCDPCDADDIGNVQIDYNFFFVIFNGIVGGFVFFSNSQHNYTVLAITPSVGSLLKPDKFNLSIVVVSTSQSFDLSYPVDSLTGTVSSSTLNIASGQTVTADHGKIIIITKSGATNIQLKGADNDVVTPPTTSGIYLDGLTTDNVPVVINVTTNQTVNPSNEGGSTDLAATAILAKRLTSIAFIPVFSPAILVRFIMSCDDDCDKFYVMVNETNFNV